MPMALEENDFQYTPNDLQSKLATFLRNSIEPYSTKHIKRHLSQHFGNQVLVSEVNGNCCYIEG